MLYAVSCNTLYTFWPGNVGAFFYSIIYSAIVVRSQSRVLPLAVEPLYGLEALSDEG